MRSYIDDGQPVEDATTGSGWMPVMRRKTPGRVAASANAMNRICCRESGWAVSIERRDSRAAPYCRFRVGQTSGSVLRPIRIVVPLEVATLHCLQSLGRLSHVANGPIRTAARQPSAGSRSGGQRQ